MPFSPFGAETAFRRLSPAVLRQHSATTHRSHSPSLLAFLFGETLRRRENVRLGNEVVRRVRGAPKLVLHLTTSIAHATKDE